MASVIVRRDGGELRVVLDRPETMNAWNAELGGELREALELARREPQVRVVVVSGAGRAFSSGADLRAGFELRPDGRPDVRSALDGIFHPLIRAVRDLPKPVIAAVNGPAVGIGCSLALACDLVVARESAYLSLGFGGIGLAPDGGASVLLPARVGLTRAAELALLGERLPARQALEWGLVNRVVADDAFEAEVDALAARLAAGPTRAYAGVKRLLNAWMLRGLAEQLDLEAEIQQELAGSDDFLEGVQAFLERRPAAFGGA